MGIVNEAVEDGVGIGWIAGTHGVAYSHAGLLALLHRLKLVYRKPDLVSANPRIKSGGGPARQEAFIADYERLLTGLGSGEAVVFADAVHPTHQARAVGCWAPAEEKIAIAPASGRDRLNIHGAVNLETGQTQMLEVAAADAQSTIALLIAILAAYPSKRPIHVFLDNARYHHACLVRQWLVRDTLAARLTFACLNSGCEASLSGDRRESATV